ncbi:MAG TPA: hypothetical protein VNQ73_07295 [Ilumatobacter sp.]|nr:hypothetical protein [Ilumatobacter sp.]
MRAPLPARVAPRLTVDQAGAAAVAAITTLVAVSWLRLLGLPFGDNHPGRVAARYALHMRNLYAQGVAESHWGAAWAPYRAEPYAHHPPLLNLADAIVGLLPGSGEWQVQLAPLTLALLAVPAAAALLRALGMSWVATLLATGALVSTGYFWIYGQVMFDIGPILAVGACAIRLRRAPNPSPWLVAATAVAAAVAMLASWPGIAFGAVAAASVAATRRDRASTVVGGAAAVGLAISLTFMVGVHGLGELTDQTEFRTQGGTFTRGRFVDQIRWYMSELLPGWYRALLVPAIVAGLADRRTRACTALTVVFAAGWIAVLNNGAYIHDYWSYLVVLPGLVGGAALVDRMRAWTGV